MYNIHRYEESFRWMDYHAFGKKVDKAVISYFTNYIFLRDFCKNEMYPTKPNGSSDIFYDNCASYFSGVYSN